MRHELLNDVVEQRLSWFTHRLPSRAVRHRAPPLQPEQDRSNDPHRPVVLGALLVARGEPPELLAAVDQPLHQAPRAIALPVEGTATPLVALARDRHIDP